MPKFKMTVEIEVEVEVEYTPVKEERMTRDYPGCPAYIEDLTVTLYGNELDHEKLAKDFRIDWEEACWEDHNDLIQYYLEKRAEARAEDLYFRKTMGG